MYFGHDIEFIKHALTVPTTTAIPIQVRSSDIILYTKHLGLCKIPFKNLHYFIRNVYQTKEYVYIMEKNESKSFC